MDAKHTACLKSLLIRSDATQCMTEFGKHVHWDLKKKKKKNLNKMESVSPSVLLCFWGHYIFSVLPGVPLFQQHHPNWDLTKQLDLQCNIHHRLNSLDKCTHTHTHIHTCIASWKNKTDKWMLEDSFLTLTPGGQWCQRNYFWKEILSGSEQSDQQ